MARHLEERWWIEAGRNQVLPLDDSLIHRISALEPPPYGRHDRVVLRPGGGPVNEDSLPMLLGGFRLEAHLEVPDAGAEGVICALGDWNNGWACYLLDGRPVLAFSILSEPTRLAAPAPLPAGPTVLSVEYRMGSRPGGGLTMRVDDAVVAEGALADHLPFRWQIGGAGLLVGRDRGLPVTDEYDPPFPCTARIRAVILEVPSAPPRDTDAELAAALRHE
jgi:arylsulfatase